MNCLIIGYGSIGRRHAAILAQMGHKICIVSGRPDPEYFRFESLDEAFRKQYFDYVVVSNRTSDHLNILLELIQLEYKGLILIEKPLFDKVYELPRYDYHNVFVAYNFRFHRVINEIFSLLQGKKMYSIQIYAGSYLPQWRPDSDYTRCYSASKSQGGGVLRDLSHELDYVNWLTGGWKSVTAKGGTFGNLKIDSDDVYSILLETSNCPVINIQMNYLDRIARREIIINLEDISLKADLIANTIYINDKRKEYDVQRNDSYMNMHNALLSGKPGNACTFEQGLEIMHLIQMTEEASKGKVWKQK